jgi:hypothetical protein
MSSTWELGHRVLGFDANVAVASSPKTLGFDARVAVASKP